ncbi:MAG TPA: DUF1214 domain-containing protein [Rhizomicrobium sp.]|nr:DUF1214 domain-containing protein [Rhizomicrobium sp.]
MRTVVKILAVIVVGTLLGLAATWFSVFRGTMAGGVSDGPWKTSLYAGSSAGGPYLRAVIAVHGLLALNRQETIYYTAATDSDGAALTGACRYEIAGRDPPTRWWSITAYGADDFLIPNPAGRYSVSMNSVARRADGTFIITASKDAGGAITAAKDAAAANWIALGGGPFSLSLRLYNPAPAVAADPAHVALPTIRKVRCG